MKKLAFNPVIRLLSVAMLAAALAACGDKSSQAPAAEPHPDAAQAHAPQGTIAQLRQKVDKVASTANQAVEAVSALTQAVQGAADSASGASGADADSKAAAADQTTAGANSEPPAAAEPSELGALANMLGVQSDQKKLDAARRKLKEAEERGDELAAARAQLEVLSATVSAVGSVRTQDLRELLPDEIGGLARSAVKSSSQSVMGMRTTEVNAEYGDALSLRIVDSGAAGLGMQAMVAALGGGGSMESEDDDSVQRSYTDGGSHIQEAWRKDGSHAELTLMLANGVQVEAEGRVAMDALRQSLLPLAQQIVALARSAD